MIVSAHVSGQYQKYLKRACSFNERLLFLATYFSENALLPGLVKGQLNDNTGSSFRDHYRELKAAAQHYETETPHSYLISKFKNLRLETYSHNFTLNYPLKKNTVKHRS